jgi:ADP-heptose:LPS heptosyltransferase
LIEPLRRSKPSQAVVAVHAGASARPRRWPARSWHQFVASTPDITFVQLGSSTDESLPTAVDYRGKLSLRVSAGVVSECDAAVVVDSFFSHVAAALCVPAIVLFLASHPASFGHVENVNIFSPIVECQPCHRPSRWLGDPLDWNCDHYRCQESITASRVADTLRELLE